MGLFERLGREVEQFKQSAQAAAEEGPDHRCADCGAEFTVDPDTCTECGSEDVEPVTE